MSIIKNVSESFKKSPAKVITISLLVLVGLIYSWHITVPVVVVVYLWKKFKRDDEKKKDTKIKCRHCKTEIPWDATRCPSCHGKLQVWTADKKIAGFVLGALVFIVIASTGSSTTTSNPTATTAPQEAHPNVEVCVESEHLLEQFLKAPSTAQFPTCRNIIIVRLPNEQFRVSSYVDSQNSFGAMIRSDWSITYHYTDGGTRTQLDYVVVNGETVFDKDAK
jgi:ribosomal protein L40E